MSHSVISPSSAHVWGKPNGCTGSVLMSQCYPDDNSDAALEGNASHWVAAEVLNSYASGGNVITCNSLVGTTDPDGTIISDEITEGADLYVKHILQFCQDNGLLAGLRVEQPVHAPSIHELSYGTCDCYVYDPKSHALTVYDYKFGYGIVEVYENWQLLNYAVGIVDKLAVNDQNLTIRMVVVQPRAPHRDGPIREWSINGGKLRGYANILSANAHRALGSDATTNSGDHCKHCPARVNCDAALQAGVNLYEVSSVPVPVDMPPQSLGLQLTIVKRALRHLESINIGLEARVDNLIRSGTLVPGWKTENKQSRNKWDKPYDEIVAVGDMLGVDLRKQELITPNQAVKKLGVDATVINAYYSKPNAGTKIVPDNGNHAKQVFTK